MYMYIHTCESCLLQCQPWIDKPQELSGSPKKTICCLNRSGPDEPFQGYKWNNVPSGNGQRSNGQSPFLM